MTSSAPDTDSKMRGRAQNCTKEAGHLKVFLYCEGEQTLEQAVWESGGVPSLEEFKRCVDVAGTKGYHSMIGFGNSGWQLVFTTLRIFSNLNDCMIPLNS